MRMHGDRKYSNAHARGQARSHGGGGGEGGGGSAPLEKIEPP